MLDYPVSDPHLADWKCKKIMEQISEFENSLDEDHEIALMLTSFGNLATMTIENVGYQNPDMLYFYGHINGRSSKLIQHVSQLNLLLTSVEKEDKSKPPRRIGFIGP